MLKLDLQGSSPRQIGMQTPAAPLYFNPSWLRVLRFTFHVTYQLWMT